VSNHIDFRLRLNGKHRCDNCGALFDGQEVKPIQDLFQRIEPGGVVPSGECPACGTLCYPVAVKEETDNCACTQLRAALECAFPTDDDLDWLVTAFQREHPNPDIWIRQHVEDAGARFIARAIVDAWEAGRLKHKKVQAALKLARIEDREESDDAGNMQGEGLQQHSGDS